MPAQRRTRYRDASPFAASLLIIVILRLPNFIVCRCPAETKIATRQICRVGQGYVTEELDRHDSLSMSRLRLISGWAPVSLGKALNRRAAGKILDALSEPYGN